MGAWASAGDGHGPAHSSILGLLGILGLLVTPVCYCHESRASAAISSCVRHISAHTHTHRPPAGHLGRIYELVPF